ncbi:EAL domain-containing protein [Achromobacter aloeverae]|uniref:cyclic-guanylate-specific phosphodiesterase n=1 Tax=Achromobacter aloeverae TaxID=1750518 RepID=A0A4Q1HEZ8_9BURK|nr:EAL domain-containing protein [Achromobacter aloeverae]RXN85162.1 cyclic diguanylate phosphodiesterase [Achromobacter aloeverae]
MPDRQTFKRRLWGTTLTILGTLAPILLILPLITTEARRQAANEAGITAAVVRKQIENILMHAEDATHSLATTSLGRPCEEVRNRLMRMGTLRPYFRSLGLVQDNQIYCWSVYTDITTPLYAISPEGEIGPGLTITPVAGTLLVPDRPAVQVSYGRAAGSGAVAFVDAQYLYDLKSAAARDGLYDIEILLGKRRLPLLDAGERERPAHEVGDETQVSSSRAYPVDVRVTVLNHQIDSFRRDIWHNYLAFLVLACLVCGYLTRRYFDRRMTLATDMRKGMRNGEFHLVYQPLVELGTGAFSGVEALLRWNHPSAGPIRPDLFIPVAEENGLIVELTRHVFALAAADLRTLGLPPHAHLGLNVCAQHMARTDFVDDVEALLRRIEGLGPITLVLEVTERAALPDSEVVRANMRRLRERGVQWAIDDFGTGHSSLAYIEQLEADFLKIDRAFVNSVGTDAVSAVVLETIITLARKLDLRMVAEGVETARQSAFLRAHGVQFGQGYYYGRPMRARDLGAWRQAFVLDPPGKDGAPLVA